MTKSKIILAYDTCLTNSVSIYFDGKISSDTLEEHSGRDAKPSRLLQMIREMMNGIEIDTSGLSAIALSRGPGSFTGIRIGIAMAKGLAIPESIPVIPISTFDAILRGCGSSEKSAIILNAGGGYYYYSDQNLRNEQGEDTILLYRWQDMQERIRLSDEVILFGSRLEKLKMSLEAERVKYFEKYFPLSQYLLEEGIEKFERGELKKFNELKPSYIKPSYVEI